MPCDCDAFEVGTPPARATAERITMPGKTSSSNGKRKIHKVMKEYKEGVLESGRGGKVTSRKQAVAIALSEARKSGARIPNQTKNS